MNTMVKIFSIFYALLLCTEANAQLFQVHRMMGCMIPAANIYNGGNPSKPPVQVETLGRVYQEKAKQPLQKNNGCIPPKPQK